MTQPINIVTFMWRGTDRPGWTDWDLNVEYVNRLYRGVKRNLSLPFKFYCFIGDTPAGGFDPAILVRPLLSFTWLGCLPKLYAYCPSNGLVGRCLMMDLDVVVTGNLDDLAAYSGRFATRSTFIKQEGAWLSGGDFAGWEAGTMNHLWDLVAKDRLALEKWTGGRERFVYRKHEPDSDFFQLIYPGQIVSYKRNVRGKGLPANARLVSCHGNPRPHEIKEQWLLNNWI